MIRRTIIETTTNKVVNIVKLETDVGYEPPEGCFLGEDGGDIGDIWNGEFYIKPSPVLPDLKEYTKEIQNHIDTVAKSKNYENGFSCATYVNSTIPQWKAEAETFIIWRDSVWSYAYQELEKVQSNLRDQPTVQELIEELPNIQW